MKRKHTTNQILIGILGLLLVSISCSRISQATDFITNPSAKEIYEREFKTSPELFSYWEAQGQRAFQDSVFVSLPYSEVGKFLPKSYPVYSYEITLEPGEKFLAEVTTDTVGTRVFMDLYRQENDSLNTFEHIKSADDATAKLEEEVASPGVYKIVIQPEIEATTPFQLKLYKQPVYVFPVVGKGNSAVQSYWGAIRDGGRRNHEGIDIFAKRGTPVVATTKGRVTSTGDKGLGGKQVWLRDAKRGNSLYYAHLDSIIATPGMSVNPGDTLGLVGNTGNARTTPPHLHFGIYKGYRGAINPLPFVYQSREAPAIAITEPYGSDLLLVKAARANLRMGPSTKSGILGQLKASDTIRMLGKTTEWYHINSNGRSSFIHENLVLPL